MLTVNNSGGTDEEIKSNFIIVTPLNVTGTAVISTVGMRELLPVRDRGNSLDILALDYYRGYYANDLVSYAKNVFAIENNSNEAPMENSEYLLIQVIVFCRGGISPVYITQRSFRVCVADTLQCSDAKQAILTLVPFEDAYLRENEQNAGWIPFVVPRGATILLAYIDETGKPAGYIRIK
jgi:PKD repeat protein